MGVRGRFEGFEDNRTFGSRIRLPAGVHSVPHFTMAWPQRARPIPRWMFEDLAEMDAEEEGAEEDEKKPTHLEEISMLPFLFNSSQRMTPNNKFCKLTKLSLSIHMGRQRIEPL